MNFSEALIELKAGESVARDGWNGKNMFIVLQKGYPDGIPVNRNTSQALGIEEGTIVRFRPYIMMYTAQGDCVPWVASQSDLLAEDWVIVK